MIGIGIPSLSTSHEGLHDFILNNFPISLNRNTKILDVGCGCGNLEGKLKQMGYSSVIGIDLGENPEYCQKLFPEYKFINHDILTKFPFKDKEFDYAFCVEVLEHVVNPFYALNEILRVAKHVIFSVPNGFWFQISPKKIIAKNGAVWFAPSHDLLNMAMYWLNAEILIFDYFYVSTVILNRKVNLKFIRSIAPSLFASTFILMINQKAIS